MTTLGTQMDENTRSREDVILQNGLLFNAIRKNKTTEKKIQKVLKYLDAGADINASDANDKNNTLLHIAVIKGELEIIQLLLERGAVRNKKNIDNLTPLEVADQINVPHKEDIRNILLRYNSIAASEETACSYNKESSAQLCQNVVKVDEYNEINIEFMYKKRSGTSGLGGQLYETKLLSLILLRALNDDNMNTFYLGTNIEGIGAFDDLILRYHLNDTDTPKIIFIQAKHKDVSGKDKLTVKEVLNENGNFSLHKYLESYITIKNKFMPNHDDIIFRGAFKDVECEFLIYTPVEENFSKKKLVADIFSNNKVSDLVSANRNGKVFQFDYDYTDVDILVKTMAISRTKLLAKVFMKLIFKDNWHNMLSESLIKIFHVYIAQHVIQIADKEKSHDCYLKAKFRSTFFESDNFLLTVFKNVVLNETLKKYGNDSSLDIENVLKSLSFNVHHAFGNLNFEVGGNDHKRRKRLNYICSTLKKLLLIADERGIITIDEELFGPGKLLQFKDIETYRLGGLVGNLLILDGKTEMLRFNNEHLLTEDIKILFGQLKKCFPHETDFERFRFDISIHEFPKLLISVKKNDNKIVREFLNKLKLYTNQAQEDVVENVLKSEIDRLYNAKDKNNSFLYRVKGDAIFLKVHHDIQKWWKQQNVAPYLTVDCNFFDRAKEDIFGSSLLSVFHFLFAKNINNNLLQFNELAVNHLDLNEFLRSDIRSLMNVVTNNIMLSSIKLNQYFQQKSTSDYIFLDLDFIIDKNSFEVVLNELNEGKVKVVIILLNKPDFFEEVDKLLNIPIEKVVVVSKFVLKECINATLFAVKTKIIDDMNKLNDLTCVAQKRVMENIIDFQGVDIPLEQILDVGVMHFIECEILWKINNGVKIKIGMSLTNSVYEEVKDCYVDRSVSRCVKLIESLKPETVNHIVMNMKNDNIKNWVPGHNQDIILISDEEQYFLELSNEFKSHNIHWFVEDNDDCIWKKSRGKLAKLFECIERGINSSNKYKLMTLKDIDDDLVVVSADPGMGKSTLLTHLAVQTKCMYPSMWVLKINLLDHRNTFNRWKDNNIDIDLIIVMKFLLIASNIQICNDEINEKDIECDISNIFNIILVNNGQIDLKMKEHYVIEELVLAEVKLFVYLFNKKKIALLLDGFDEICPDYSDEVIRLVDILKDCKMNHLWIASRSYNIVKRLENRLCVFSFNLDPLAVADQKIFLEMLLSKRLQEQRCDRLSFYVNRFFETVSQAINDRHATFMGIPLHTYMISEIFADFFKDFYDLTIPRLSERYMEVIQEVGNMIALYEKFSDIKFHKIRFGEKKPFISANDPDMKKIIANERRHFVQIHKYLAAYLVLDKTVKGLFSEHELNEIYELIRRVRLGEEKTGIVNNVVSNEPKFIHFTFAEYFANEYLCDKLKSDTCTADVWVYLFDSILNSDNSGIRKFFECKLGRDQVLADLSSTVDHKQVVFETLLTQRSVYTTALYVAIEEYSNETAIFLLKSVKNVLTKNNLDDFISFIVKRCLHCCSFCGAVDRGCKIVIEFVLDTVKEIDDDKIIRLFQCRDLPNFNPFCLAVNYCELDKIVHDRSREIVGMLLKYINKTDSLVEMFMLPCNLGVGNGTSLHLLASDSTSITVVLEYLLKLNSDQRMTVISAVDRSSKLAAHYAGMNGALGYFETLETILDVHQFTKICVSLDLKKFTPLSYLKVCLGNSEKLDLLIQKVKEHSDICDTCSTQIRIEQKRIE